MIGVDRSSRNGSGVPEHKCPYLTRRCRRASKRASRHPTRSTNKAQGQRVDRVGETWSDRFGPEGRHAVAAGKPGKRWPGQAAPIPWSLPVRLTWRGRHRWSRPLDSIWTVVGRGRVGPHSPATREAAFGVHLLHGWPASTQGLIDKWRVASLCRRWCRPTKNCARLCKRHVAT